MKIVTIVFLVTPRHVWLAPKKRKCGVGFLNGYGGKVENGESILESAVRETEAESLVALSVRDLVLITTLDFFKVSEHIFQGHIFLATRWSGQPQETVEMGRPELHLRKDPPLQRMLKGDALWVPRVMEGLVIPLGGFVRHNRDMTEATGHIPSAS